MKKLAALLLCVLMMTSAAMAAIEWPASPTAGHRQLQTFVETANAALAANGGGVIDMRYELYTTFASLGMDGVEMPEDPFADFTMPVELHVTMAEEGVHAVTLRMQDVNRFAVTAAACIHAASPNAVSYEQAHAITKAYAASVLSEPNRGFEEEVNDVQGYQPRAYFAYYPNQFQDERNWIQLTLIFSRPGSVDAPVIVPVNTPAPTEGDHVWLSEDNFSHLEIFVTPTPEPDSAAME